MNSQLWLTDNDFPPLLRQINDAPKRLKYLGQRPDSKADYFAIVGTRHMTPYGKNVAYDFAHALAKRFVIVSGLAYGIDAVAHRAALDAGGKTVAVLGSGLNKITPPCNLGLAKEIQKNGSIISEYEDDFGPFKGTFPQRNRIIAGMSIATLVIEAPERSGALITARLALEYNRDVFAIPGNITQETSKGTNKFIRDGKAFPTTCVQDIFDYLELSSPPQNSATKSQEHALSTDEESVYSLLKNSHMSIDDLVAETGLQTSRINTVLSLLELKGLIEMSGSYAFITR